MKDYIRKMVEKEQKAHSKVKYLIEEYGGKISEAEKHIDYNEAAYAWIEIKSDLKKLKQSIQNDYDEIMELFDETTY